MSKQLLSSDSSESEGELDFKVNEAYAKKHQHQHELAERFRLEAKYGKNATEADADVDDSDSEADVTEDEDGEQVTADVDAAILRTLIRIRKGDKSVYDPSARIFDEERQALPPASGLARQDGSNRKKMTLSDFQRKRFQELAQDEEHAAERLADATTVPSKRLGDANPTPDPQPRTHAQEEEDLKRETVAAFHAGDSEEDRDDDEEKEAGGLFMKRSEGQEESYRDYLLHALGGDQAAVDAVLRERAQEARKYIMIDDNGEPIGPKAALTNENQEEVGPSHKTKTKTKTKTQEEKDQDFLMNYILNRGWMNQDSSEPQQKRDWDAEAAELDSDASFASHADEWENDFNMRFENGTHGPTVPSFSRDAAAVNSVRREDNKRKRQREERKARKAAEKQERMQEIERLQHLKRKDILERVEQLRHVTGNKDIGPEDLDLEGDFDPEAHDQAMQKAFNDEYYEAPDEGEEEDGMRLDADGKPVWDDDIDIGDILKEEEAYEREHTTGKERRQKAKAERKNQKESKKTSGRDEDDNEGHVPGEEDDDSRIEMDADFADGQAPAAVDESKLSKKERKKLKKKAKKDAEQAARRGEAVPTGEEEDGVDMDEMDAEKQPLRTAPHTEDELSKLSSEERKKAVSRMLDDYYQTGAEDVIGGMPTRFKYVQVPKATYGMSPVEILLADDKELNQVVGVKHIQPYRREIGKPTRPQFLSRKLKDFRHNLASRYDDGSGLGNVYASKASAAGSSDPRQPGISAGEEGPKKRRKGKKERDAQNKRKAEQGEHDIRSEKKQK